MDGPARAVRGGLVVRRVLSRVPRFSPDAHWLCMTMRARAAFRIRWTACLVCPLVAWACGNALIVANGSGADSGSEAGSDASSGGGEGDGTTDATDAMAPVDAPVGQGDGALDGSSDAPSSPVCAVCPASPPEAGAPCSSAGVQTLECEYGDDPRPGVNLFARCLAGRWFYSLANSFPFADSGLPIGDAGCPPTIVEAGPASSCGTPRCVYPEGTCTCYVDPGLNAGDGGTFWSCLYLPLPPGCPATLAEAQSAGCTATGSGCFYAEGTCHCGELADGGGPTSSCTVPVAGCPSTRPRIGSACDPTVAQYCRYGIPGCGEFPNADLRCNVPQAANDASSCQALWFSNPNPPLCPPMAP